MILTPPRRDAPLRLCPFMHWMVKDVGVRVYRDLFVTAAM